MRTFCIAQGTLLNALDGKEVLKGGDMCMCKADSFCYTSETNTTL